MVLSVARINAFKPVAPRSGQRTQTTSTVAKQLRTRWTPMAQSKLSVASSVRQYCTDDYRDEYTVVPAIGQPAPAFTAEALVGKEFKEISLSDYKGKYVVLFFYPLDFTFVCPSEIVAFSDAVAKFKALDCEVLGASIDSKFSHYAWTEVSRKEGGLGEMNIPLLADVKRDLSTNYGAMLSGAGHTLRATYIIDREGVLRHMSFNDPPVGRSVDEVLRLVEGYQFNDVNGEVCPAGWTKGDATIKPDPVGKVEFFKNQPEE